MVFVYVFLLGALVFSRGQNKKVHAASWYLVFAAVVLAILVFIFHTSSPLEIQL